MEGSDGILTYTFNMGTQSPFGFIFIGAITTGALVFCGSDVIHLFTKNF